ncbi:MAG TPA: hypothetical protein C5S50_00160 [Methanosarcinaceae archaeon]|nr:hypothetical protein [Methanosarcinaceae archaeon]
MKIYPILVGITISLLLLLPAAASENTLGIFGNANGDDTIDMQDIEYTGSIILRLDDQTQFADAKYDGGIDILDLTQTELIICGKEKELTLIDSANRTVTVNKPVERIVSLSSDSAEAIKVVGAKENIVGRSMHVNDEAFFPDLIELPSVGSATKPDCEKILELQPDIVITYALWKDPVNELEEKLKPANITVVCLDCYKPFELEKDVKRLGYILDKRDRAEEFIDFYQSYLITISERVEGLSEEDKPRVYSEGYGDYTAHGIDSGGHQMIVMAGGINIAADLPKGAKIDPEWIIEQNPDVITKAVRSSVSCGYDVDDPSEVIALREVVVSRPGFNAIVAVENDRVCMIAPYINTQPAFFVGITYRAKWFHPELFEDLDPQAIHQEYLTEFQGLDIDLNTQGVFVYPEPE